MSIVSQNIKYLRRMNGLTQEQFARRIGIKRSLVGAYEEARANPPLDKLKIIANTFNITVDSLIKTDIRKLRETPDMTLAFSREGKTQQARDLAAEFLNKLHPSSQIPTPKPSVFVNETFPPKETIKQESEKVEEHTIRSENNHQANGHNKFIIISLNQQVPYINNIYKKDFFSSYELYSLPNIKGEFLRGFELGNDFPIKNAVLIGDYFKNIQNVVDGTSYILVTKNSGIIYRRVYNQLKLKNKLLLSSDISTILSQEITENDILELWEVKGFFTTELPKPNPTLEKLESLISNAAFEIERLKKTQF